MHFRFSGRDSGEWARLRLLLILRFLTVAFVASCRQVVKRRFRRSTRVRRVSVTHRFQRTAEPPNEQEATTERETMTVAFKELAGSPVETHGPEGFQAKRVLLCAWDEREELVQQLVGDGHILGGRSRAPYPGKPDVVALRARCEPITDDVLPQELLDLTEGLNRYHGFAKVTVDYELLPAADRSDIPNVVQGTFLTYQQGFDAETLSLSGDSFTWEAEPSQAVPDKAVPSLRVPLVEHHLTWHRVISPPWQAIRECIGTVNNAMFLGAAAETVLLDGAKADREFLRIDGFANAELAWRIRYTFRERAVKTGASAIVGWNHSYRSLPIDDPDWDRLVDGAGNRPYRAADFTRLFEFETPIDV